MNIAALGSWPERKEQEATEKTEKSLRSLFSLLPPVRFFVISSAYRVSQGSRPLYRGGAAGAVIGCAGEAIGCPGTTIGCPGMTIGCPGATIGCPSLKSGDCEGEESEALEKIPANV